MAKNLDWQDFPGEECIDPPAPEAVVEHAPRSSAPHESTYPSGERDRAYWPDLYDDDGNDMRDLRFSGVDLSFHAGHTTLPHPPRHPDAKPPPRCQGTHCCYYEIGYIGHWTMFCMFQQKCIMRSVSRIKKHILNELLKREAFSTHSEFVTWLFEHIPYSELGVKESELVESLEHGEYGFRERGRLSVKQLKMLKDIYCRAASRADNPEHSESLK